MAAPTYVDTVQSALSTNVTSYTVTLPSYAAGDVVLILVDIDDTETLSLTYTGWTLAANLARNLNAGGRTIVLYRVMDGSEGASMSIGLGVTVSNVRGRAISYRGCDTSNPVDGSIFTASSTSSGSSWTIGPTTTSGADRVYVGLLGFQATLTGNGANPSTAGVTERSDAQDFSTTYGAIEELPAPTAGSYSIAGTFTRSSARVLVGIALAPPSSTSSIKTILGVAKSSVKTVEGLAIASVKTVEGLA